MSNRRWSIWIDVEGFSTLYRSEEARAIAYLGELMEALFLIGTKMYPQEPERLFIHQFGDGFVVVSSFEEASPERPLAICIAVMRHLLKKRCVTKAAISVGGFFDVSSCYPKSVMEASKDRRHVGLGEGLMTIIPVMGTAFIAAYKLADRHSGALLLVDTIGFVSLPKGLIATPGTPDSIDWIHSYFPEVDEICEKTGLEKIDNESAEAKMKEYLDAHKGTLSKGWVESTVEALHLIL